MNATIATVERKMFLTAPIVSAAMRDAFRKLDPRVQIRNPVMFVVYVGSILTTVIGVAAALAQSQRMRAAPASCSASAAWLWLTVLFANFAEAVAEGRGKAQAATLRSMRRHVHRQKRSTGSDRADSTRRSRQARSSAATSCSSKPTTSFPPTARSSKASRR